MKKLTIVSMFAIGIFASCSKSDQLDETIEKKSFIITFNADSSRSYLIELNTESEKRAAIKKQGEQILLLHKIDKNTITNTYYFSDTYTGIAATISVNDSASMSKNKWVATISENIKGEPVEQP